MKWLLAFVGTALADTCANCHYNDIVGVWDFKHTADTYDNTVKCDDLDESLFTKLTSAEIHDIHHVTELNGYGNTGEFTLIYNQGFEIKLNNHIWFAFFENGDAGYDENGQPVEGCEYSCDRTMRGWVHDTLSNQWACFIGTRQNPNNKLQTIEEKTFIPHELPESQVAYYKAIEKLGLFKYSGKKSPSLYEKSGEKTNIPNLKANHRRNKTSNQASQKFC